MKAGEKNLTIYGSVETHNSVDKSVGLLGLGENAFRKIPVDADYRIDLGALRAAIAADRKNGMHPFCIVGNAGAVNTGAFGAWAAIAQESKHLASGMHLADSIAFDLHKWMYMQYEVGCCLVRNAGEHRNTFAVGGSYLTAEQRGFIAGPLPWREYGIQLSREFRALKVWMSLKEHGAAAYRKLIQQNIDQAAYLGSLIEADPHLELVAPIPSNVVCFRFCAAGSGTERLNAINREILLRLQEGGIAVPSSTTLHGTFAIRAAITNHRSARSDFQTLTQNVVRIGLELTDV